MVRELPAPGIDRAEIDLTDEQLTTMTRDELETYEALFRAAFDRGLWVTHWRDHSFGVTHYVISVAPPNDQ